MERRKLLKGLGGAAGAATLGGIGLLTTSSSAVATASGDLGSTSVSSDDGSVKWVATQTTGRVKWDGFDAPVEEAKITVRVQFHRGGSMLNEYKIHETNKFGPGDGNWQSDDGNGEEFQSGREGYIASDADWGIAQANRENTYNEGYGLPENPAPTAPLEVDSDGNSVKTKVVLVSEYALYAGSGAELTGTSGYPDRPVAKTHTTLTVTNEQATTSFGGSDAQGESGDDADAA